MKGILGQKLGMTAIYGELGTQIPVTAVYVGGNKVVGKRTQDRDGYTALIVGFGEQKLHRLNKPTLGFLKKQGLITDEQAGTEKTVRHLREFRMGTEELEGFENCVSEAQLPNCPKLLLRSLRAERSRRVLAVRKLQQPL